MDPNQLEPIVESILIVLIEALRERLTRQGHRLSGRLIKSMRFKVDVKGEKIVGDILMEHMLVFWIAAYLPAASPFQELAPAPAQMLASISRG